MGLDWIMNKIFSSQEYMIVLSEDTKENDSTELPRVAGQVLSHWQHPAVWIIKYPHSGCIIWNFTTSRIEKFPKAVRGKKKVPYKRTRVRQVKDSNAYLS